MALGHVYQSNHTTQISVAKIKSARVLATAGRHNMRDKARLGKKEANHIDPAGTHLNQTIRQNISSNLYCEILSKVTGKVVTPKMAKKIDPYDLHYADGKKVRMGQRFTRYDGIPTWYTLRHCAKRDVVLKYFTFCGMAHVRKIVREKNPDG